MGFRDGALSTVALISSSLQTNTNTFANSADPDEMPCNELFHLDLHFAIVSVIFD